MSRLYNIIIVETSPLISEGLAAMLEKTGIRCRLSFAGSPEEAELLFAKTKYRLMIVNPGFFYGNPRLFSTLKGRLEQVKLAGLVYAWHDPEILAMFDALINAADSPKTIEITLTKLMEEGNESDQSSLQDILTSREIDVLKLLATGHANKEIADELNISIHTVITHRKNISQKTGIKTVSGLTIYAVTQKLISIDTIKE